MPEPVARPPTERNAAKPSRPEIKRTIHEHLDLEPGRTAQLHSPHSALDTVAQLDLTNTGNTRKIAGPLPQRPDGQLRTEDVHAQSITHPPLTLIVCPVTNDESAPARNDTTAASSAGVPRRLIDWWSITKAV